MKTIFQIGSISANTYDKCDIALAIHTEIDYVNSYHNAQIEIPEPYEGFDGFDSDDTFWTTDEACEYLEKLYDLMNENAPAYSYFGSHEGNSSDVGFWPNREEIDELPSVESGEEAKELGEDCRQVNDHGNLTVWGGDGKEIWSIV